MSLTFIPLEETHILLCSNIIRPLDLSSKYDFLEVFYPFVSQDSQCELHTLVRVSNFHFLPDIRHPDIRHSWQTSVRQSRLSGLSLTSKNSRNLNPSLFIHHPQWQDLSSLTFLGIRGFCHWDILSFSTRHEFSGIWTIHQHKPIVEREAAGFLETLLWRQKICASLDLTQSFSGIYGPIQVKLWSWIDKKQHQLGLKVIDINVSHSKSFVWLIALHFILQGSRHIVIATVWGAVQFIDLWWLKWTEVKDEVFNWCSHPSPRHWTGCYLQLVGNWAEDFDKCNVGAHPSSAMLGDQIAPATTKLSQVKVWNHT